MVTFSPKIFLPVTRLCRNRCGYCSFRRDADDPARWTMAPEQVEQVLDEAVDMGCFEALLCLGDTPESFSPAYRRLLASWGFDSTVAYLEHIARRALDRGLLPHTNAGMLSAAELARLRQVNVSMGLMLETVAERLCQPGGPHALAPDKRPARRLRMLEDAGRLRIPFTTGLLVGIGETAQERTATLEAIAGLHRRFGHIQEVIVQPFRAGASTPMDGADEVDEHDFLALVSEARVLLPDDVRVQVPPNLGGALAAVRAGADDLGGISPLTPDFINPGHPWPVIDGLARELALGGHSLVPRLAVQPGYIEAGGWLDPSLVDHVEAARARLVGHPRWRTLAAA